MSSRFVSAGAIDPTTGEAAGDRPTTAAAAQGDDAARSSDNKKPNDEWLAVEKELEAERRRREEARRAAAAGGERSLFEVLQANKEAKQAAFEEANKIKNQFRALDDDEIDFLDEVKARQRAEEDRVRRETEEGVEAFRAAQREKERAATGEGEGDEEGDEGAGWVAGGRKRKRVAHKGTVAGLKRRTTSEGERKVVDDKNGKGEGKEVEPPLKAEGALKAEEKPKHPTVAAPAKPMLGLVSYDSDDDD